MLDLWVFFEFNALALDLLAPAVLVEALSEEDNVCEHCLIVLLVDPVAHTVQIKGKDLVHLHLLTVLVVQQVVVTLPLLLVGSGRQLMEVVR